MRMIRTLLDSPSVAIATGALMTYPLPLGRPIRRIVIEAKRSADGLPLTRTELAAELNYFEQKANTETIAKHTIAEALAIAMNYRGATEGAAADDGTVILPRVLRQIVPGWVVQDGVNKFLDGESYRFGTVGISSYQLQIKLGTVAQLAYLQVYVDTVDIKDELPGLFLRTVSGTESGFGTAEKRLENLVPRSGSKLVAIHITGYGSGVLRRASLKYGERELQRLTTGSVGGGTLGRTLKDLGRLPQASYYHLDFANENTLNDLPDLTPDLDPKVMLEWSTAPDSGTFSVLIERQEEFGVTFGSLKV